MYSSKSRARRGALVIAEAPELLDPARGAMEQAELKHASAASASAQAELMKVFLVNIST
jgi:hypothetical protein